MANPCSSKYTQSKYIEHCQKLHKKKLAQMKPAIDNKSPKKPSHFKNNRKREQMMEGKNKKFIGRPIAEFFGTIRINKVSSFRRPVRSNREGEQDLVGEDVIHHAKKIARQR